MKHELLPRDKKLRLRAAELRKNATVEENHLWYDFLRAYPAVSYTHLDVYKRQR